MSRQNKGKGRVGESTGEEGKGDGFWKEGFFAESLDPKTAKERMKTFHMGHNEDMSYLCRKCGAAISAHNKDWHAGLCDKCFGLKRK